MRSVKQQIQRFLICTITFILCISLSGCYRYRANQKHFFIIERFEGNYAICGIEDGTFFHLPASIIPPHAKEGAILSLEMQYIQEYTVRNSLKKRIGKLLK